MADVSRIPLITIGTEPPEDSTEGDLWWSPVTGQQYVWYNDGNTVQWVISNWGAGKPGLPGEKGDPGSPGLAEAYIGEVPPPDPTAGALWWSSALGELFVWYDDGDSQQWVVTNLGGGGGNSVGRMGSLSLRDYMHGDFYCNDAFKRAQQALLDADLRSLYVPGGKYTADPTKPEIQLVLDDLHIWADNEPLFYSAKPEQGFFQVIYAKRVKIEGVRIELDASLVRENVVGGYAGDKYNSRRSAVGIYDSDDFWLDKVFARNWCGGFIGKGYHTSTTFDAWKLLSPTQRIATYINLTNVQSMSDFPDLPRSLCRAQGLTRIEGLRTEHCDFGILYSSIENIRVYDFDHRDTTITQAHPHAIYSGSNITYDSDPLSPTFNQMTQDKSNGVGKFTRLWDYDNQWAISYKFRVHDQITVSDVHSRDTGGGISFINNDGARLDGGTFVDMHESQTYDPDPDDPEDTIDTKGYGLRVSGCRDGVFQNLRIFMRGGNPLGTPLREGMVGGNHQRRNTATGELFYSRSNTYRNIFIKTNYADQDQDRDFVGTFDPESIVAAPITVVGEGGDQSTGATFESIEHVDAWGHYPSTAWMFQLRSGSNARIITPVYKGASTLVQVHRDSTNNLVVIDPDLVASRKIVHLPPPLDGTDYTRVHVIRPIKGDNSAYLADFGPLDTGANVAETINRAALIVGRRGPGTIHLPSGSIPVGPYVPTQISATEGSTIIMTAAMSGITWQGHNSTLLPTSNKVSIFDIDGATDTKFLGIKFDNSANGCLHGMPATGPLQSPGGGVAANGNSQNTSVTQWSGANTLIDRCEFIQIHTCFKYHGNYLDRDHLFGTAELTNSRFDGCAFGFTPSQPEHVVCNGNKWVNSTDSLAANATTAPGHLVYITNKPGAAPYTVMANNNYARHTTSSVLKLRKGITQTCTGNVFEDVHRGIECHNARIATITGNTIKLTKWPTDRVPRTRPPFVEGYHGGIDDNQSAIEVTGCYGGGVISNNTIDRSGSYGFAMRIRPGDLAEDDEGEIGDGEYPRNLHIHHNKIVDDCSSAMIQPYPEPPESPTAPLPPEVLAPFKPWIQVLHLTDGDVSDNTLHVLTDTVVNEYMILANYCERSKFFNNARMAVFRPEGSNRLVNIGPASNNCVVGYKAEDISVAIDNLTVRDAGTNTRRIRTDGIRLEEWTPIPTFDPVPLGFNPVIVESGGWIERQGQMATVGGNLTFNTGGYTPPAVGTEGFFKILFPYTSDTFGDPFHANVGFHRQFTIPHSSLGIGMRSDEPYFTLHYNEPAGDGLRLTTAHVLPNKLIDIGFQIRIQLNSTGPFDHVILPETQRLLDSGWTPSTPTILQRVDQCIRDLKSNGLWDKILACWGANSLLNWKKPSVNAMVAVGAPTFIEDDYFSGTGADTDYYNTGLNLSTGGAGIYTQNSASMWRWSTIDVAGDTSADMGCDATANIIGRNVAGNLVCTGNSVAASSTLVVDSKGLAGWTRSVAGSVTLFKDHAPTVVASVSTAVSATTLKIGRAQAGNASARHLKFAGVGGALTDADIVLLDTIIGTYAAF